MHAFPFGRVRRLRTKLRRGLVLALIVVGHPTVLSIVAGAVLIFVGQVVHFEAAGTLVKTDELTIAGPYRHVRNPLYIGSFLTDAAFCLAARSLLAALLWMPLFYLGVIHRRVQAEEAELLAIHGEAYRAYLAAVPRYIPSLKPRTPPGRGRFTWSHLVRNGEPSRQLHHFAFPLIMLAKLRLIGLQGGAAWSLGGLPGLLRDTPGRIALAGAALLLAAPWCVRQARKFRRHSSSIRPA